MRPRTFRHRSVLGALAALALSALWAERASADESKEPDATEAPRRMGDAAELEKGSELYLSGQYDACLEHFGRLLDLTKPLAFTDSAILEKGRLYAASCAVLSGRLDTARTQLKNALAANPLMPTPDSLSFPPPLVGLFLEVREEVQQIILAREREQIEKLRLQAEGVRKEEEARARRERELYRIAEQEPVVLRSSRFVASLPFGAGQFQNGSNALGTLFLVTEVAALATAGVSGAVTLQLYSDVIGEAQAAGGKNARLNSTYDAEDESVLRTAHATWAFSTVAFLTLAGLGVLEAHLAYEDERTVGTRRRSLPSDLRPKEKSLAAPPSAPTEQKATVTPVGAASTDGFFLGAKFSF